MDGRSWEIRKIERRNMKRVKDLKEDKVDLEWLGNWIGRKDKLEIVKKKVKKEEEIDEGRWLLVIEVKRKIKVEERIRGKEKEVEMLREVKERIKMVVIREEMNIIEVKLDSGKSGIEEKEMDIVENIIVGEGDWEGIMIVEIDEWRNMEVEKKLEGGKIKKKGKKIGIEKVSIDNGI